jgi:hypothetical protein
MERHIPLAAVRLLSPGRARTRACFALIAALFAMQFQWWWTPGQDASSYLSIAKHLSEGRLQRFDDPHLKYAPGYPLLIAPAFWFSDEPFATISLIHFGLALALAAGVHQWFRRWAPGAADLLTLFMMVNVSVWHLYRLTLSELAFMAELTWGAYALVRLMESAETRARLRWGALAVGLITLSAWTRQVGVFLLVGFGIACLTRAIRREWAWRRAITTIAGVGAPVTLLVLALIVWDHSVAATRGAHAKSYTEYLDDETLTFGQQVAEGVRLRIAECGRLLIPGMYKSYAEFGEWLNVNSLVYLALFALLTIAFIQEWRRTNDPFVLTLPCYVAFFLFWPFNQGTRYLLPMLPVLTLCLWALLERTRTWRAPLFSLLIVIHLCVSIGYWVKARDGARLHPLWNELATLAPAIEPELDRTNVIGVPDPVFLMSVVEYQHRFDAHQPREEITPETRWVITAKDAVIPAGFAAHTRTPRLQLLHRITESPNPTPGPPERLATAKEGDER